MKNVFRLLIIAALATAFALPAFAQDAQPTAAQCTADADAKNALYQKFLANYKGTPDKQKVAYDTGKEYLTKYGNCPDEGDKKIAQFIQNWVTKYEAALVEFNCTDAVNKRPAEAFQACQTLINKDPNNLKPYLMLVTAGVKNLTAGNKSFNADTVRVAQKALDLIAAGKTTDNWIIGANQQETVAGLNYYVGVFSLDNSPGDAAAALLKTAQSNTKFSKEPSTYSSLGLAYYNNEFKKLAQEYKDKCEGKEASPECDALFARVNQVLDRVIDAYARAVALANNDPKQYGPILNQVKPVLTALYKQRHPEPDANLDAYIASVLSKPLPIPGQEPPPTVTPASSSGTTGTDGTGTTPKPATTPATTPTKPASTTPAKPPVSKAAPAAKSGAAATSGH
jgi:hypothetical protein